MGFLEYVLIVAIVAQVLFTIHVARNYRYAMQQSDRKRSTFRPRCALIVPCKGLDEAFDKNIESYFHQKYQDYHLFFVVEDRSEPTYDCLSNLRAKYGTSSQARTVEILVAGPTASSSQKLHNLLFAYREIPKETEVLVFADSDACAGPNWLAHIVHPLRKDKNRASSGCRTHEA